MSNYRLVLGLEIHWQPNTTRKMFCRCSTDIWKKEPNTRTCPTCLGLPGALPVPNLDAVRKTQLLGIALGCKINERSKFDRKHYFYPDLPKGYQISQYKEPLCFGGGLGVAELERIHLEEDTAKSIHKNDHTLVNFNTSGMPLIEIVTKPCFTTVEDAVVFSKSVQKLVRDLGLGDVAMEKGQMRLEPNISLRTMEMEEKGELPQYKVEIKNINSFKFMKKAVKAEINRQTKLLDSGATLMQENRGYNEHTGTTVSQRSKESAHDYRYFPEPDIPPMVFDNKYLEDLQNEYENIKKLVEKSAANVVINKRDPKELFDTKISDENELGKLVKEVISVNPDVVKVYKAGKENALQFLVGQIMSKTKGRADVKTVLKLFKKSL